MSNKIVIVDGQVFQTAAWDRGMGKYSLELLSALCKNKDYRFKEIRIILSDNLKMTDEARLAINHAVPRAVFVFLKLDAPNIHRTDDITPMLKHNRLVLNRYIDSVIGNDSLIVDFIILSLFLDQTCSVFPDNTRKILLFYDLIPLLYSNRYGVFHNYTNYLRRFSAIIEADYIWTISQTVSDDLMLYMGLPSSRLCNINGAPIQRDHQKSSMLTHEDIPSRYLLMPSGNDLRKNNEKALHAVDEYKSMTGDDISVVVTSTFDEDTRDKLRQITDKVIFTGNIPEGELKWLYQNATALLFVPEYEGLGLPILEAVEYKLPIICSNLTVFDEMSSTAFYNADQHNPTSIAEGIQKAINKIDWPYKLKQYPEILARYTWDNTVRDAVAFINKDGKSTAPRNRPKIAIFTPNPSSYSAIGKFNMHLHPSLLEYFEIDYYIEDGVGGRQDVRPNYLPYIANTYKASSFNAKKYAKYDAVLYHIGNSEFHIETIKNALHLPGYVVMHDIKLKSVFEQVMYSEGLVTSKRLVAEQMIDNHSKSKDASYVSSIVNAQLGLISHSKYANNALRGSLLQTIKNTTSQLPVATPVMRKQNLRKRLSVGFAGIIHPAKGLTLLDDIIKSDRFKDVDIYLFGTPLVPDSELRRIESLPNVEVITNLTDFEFQSKIADIDVLINYRPDYNGESSAATVEAMRYGVVPIVRDIGWFSELPDDAVMKVEGIGSVLGALRELCDNPEKLKAMSNACIKTTTDLFSQQSYAESISKIINEDIASNPDTLNHRIKSAIHTKKSKRYIKRLM